MKSGNLAVVNIAGLLQRHGVIIQASGEECGQVSQMNKFFLTGCFMTVWASGSAQAEADRFDGTYAIDPGTLACVVGEGDVPGAAIRIEAGRFFGPAIVCQMQNPTSIRDMSAMLFDFACSGEGRE